MSLSQEEIEKIATELAPMLVSQVRKDHHDFWIDPEIHYKDHLDIRNWIDNLNSAQKIFWTGFLGFVVIGMITLAAVGMIPKLKFW